MVFWVSTICAAVDLLIYGDRSMDLFHRNTAGFFLFLAVLAHISTAVEIRASAVGINLYSNRSWNFSHRSNLHNKKNGFYLLFLGV